MKKGQVVTVSAKAITGYLVDFDTNIWEIVHEPKHKDGSKENVRCLFRQPLPENPVVLLVGTTTIQTGIRQDGHEYGYAFEEEPNYDPAHLCSDKHHKVWVVEIYSETNQRYTSPFYVLESDIHEQE